MVSKLHFTCSSFLCSHTYLENYHTLDRPGISPPSHTNNKTPSKSIKLEGSKEQTFVIPHINKSIFLIYTDFTHFYPLPYSVFCCLLRFRSMRKCQHQQEDRAHLQFLQRKRKSSQKSTAFECAKLAMAKAKGKYLTT